jgi:lipooligosaccharide transport system permease protein
MMRIATFDFSASGIWAVFLRHKDVFMRGFYSAVIPPFFEPVFYLLAMGYGLGALIADVEGMSYAQFIAPSLVAMVGLTAPGFECLVGTLARLVVQRTFEAIISTPVSIEDVIAGEVLYGAAKGIVHAVAVGIVVAAFGLIPSWWGLMILVVILFGGLMIGAVTIVYTSFMPNFNPIDFYFTLVLTPLFLFSGTFFPVSQLPWWGQRIAEWTPFFHMVRPSRMFALGVIDWRLVGIDFLWIAGYFVVFFPIAVWLFRRRLVK